MRVLISGSSGLVGRALVPALERGGHTVVRLVRRRARDEREAAWDPAAGVMDPAAPASCDAIIHLAGAGIATGRWTDARKAAIMESRRAGTRTIAEAVARAARPPGVFICASAIGLYGDRGDEVLTEASPPGAGFLADVVRAWELEARRAGRDGVRCVQLRFGLVLSGEGGALPRMALPFRLGVGGPVGGGRQWMSWITLQDLVRVVEHILSRPGLGGPVNAVAPGAIPNREFCRALADILHRPALFPLPAWAVGALLGEMGRELLLFSQRVLPERLVEDGFTFASPGIESALRRAFGPGVAGD